MLLLASQLVASMMFAAGCALLTAILLRRSYRYFGKNRRRRYEGPIDAQPRPKTTWDGAYTDRAAVIEREKVELYELGRELKAQLDNKISLLESLCARSQRQIDRLEALLDKKEEA